MRTDKERRLYSILLITILPLISVFTVVIIAMLYRTDIIDILKISIITFLLTTVMVFYIRLKAEFPDIKFSKSIIFISYFISILLIMLPNNPQIYSFWMIGGLINAMLIGKMMGLLVYFNLTFILSITHSLGTDTIIHYLIMGVLFILLSEALKKKDTVIYGAIILLSSNITLSFIMNNFIFDLNSNTNYLASFFSIFAVLVTAFLISVLYERFIDNKLETAHETHEIIEDREDEIISTNLKNTKTSYDVLLSDDNELLLRIKEHSENLYKHCRLIGDLSGRAAKLIGADEYLARAGGYYHEVGKINGKNYIEEGLKLAEEYSFPEKLKHILKQHNIKYDKPTFVESAIVMISDNVATTIEYIDKTGNQKFSSDKIIDNIFRIRMDKGTFDDSGLSVRDYKLLKEFYQNEFKTIGKNEEDSH